MDVIEEGMVCCDCIMLIANGEEAYEGLCEEVEAWAASELGL